MQAFRQADFSTDLRWLADVRDGKKEQNKFYEKNDILRPIEVQLKFCSGGYSIDMNMHELVVVG